MKKRIFKISKNILSLLLCLCMLSAVLSMISCNVADDDDGNAGTEELETVEVLRLVDDVKYGARFTNDKLATVTVRADAVPEGAITNMNDLRAKYAAAPLCAGDYITPEKLTNKKPADAEDDDDAKAETDYKSLGYVVITDYKIEDPREDYSHVINKVIAENPGATIYFPDGEYNITAPIVIPADPAKSVSLRLSNLAVIKATSWEDKSLPMIRMGVEDETATAAEGTEELPTMDEALSEQRSTYIIGGCIYANGLASGISIEGGKDTLLYNVSIKSIADFGIHVHYGNNELGATYANVDNVNITGVDSSGSVGVLVDGTHNTFANMRIYRIQYGTYCTETGSNNIFRNLHPLASTGHGDATVSFYDKSNGNNYDICYSDQFSTGFVMHENTRSVYNGSFCYWYNEANGYHVAFRAVGAYNSIWVGGKSAQSASHNLHTDACMLVCKEDDPETTDVDESITEVLWGSEDEAPSKDVAGKGVVIYPIYANTSKVYNYILNYYSRTEMLK